MIAKDLMIGDWVDVVNINHKVEELNDEIIDLGYEKTKRTIKISAVNLTGIHYDCEEYGPIFVPIEDLQSIPLTPEILEKNGFTSVEDQYNHKKYFLLGKNEYNCNVYWDGLAILLIEEDYEPTTYAYICDAEYVHELQHALKLCKNEKEIVL